MAAIWIWIKPGGNDKYLEDSFVWSGYTGENAWSQYFDLQMHFLAIWTPES